MSARTCRFAFARADLSERIGALGAHTPELLVVAEPRDERFDGHGIVVLAERDHVIRQGHLRSVEFFVAKHAQKDLRRRRDVDKLDIDAVDFDSTVREGARMIVVATTNRNRPSRHLFSSSFSLKRLDSRCNRGEKSTRERRGSTFTVPEFWRPGCG